MLVWCDGESSVARTVEYPPPPEIAVDQGLHVSIDRGPPETWRYEFVGS